MRWLVGAAALGVLLLGASISGTVVLCWPFGVSHFRASASCACSSSPRCTTSPHRLMCVLYFPICFHVNIYMPAAKMPARSHILSALRRQTRDGLVRALCSSCVHRVPIILLISADFSNYKSPSTNPMLHSIRVHSTFQ